MLPGGRTGPPNLELGLSFGQHVSQAKIPADLLNPLGKSARPLLRLSIGDTKIEGKYSRQFDDKV